MSKDIGVLKKYSVLYVEDEAMVRLATLEGLQNSFKKIVAAENGQEAWDIFQKERFDILITDIAMPHMDGLELSSRVKELEPDTLVFITSAYDYSEYMLKAIELGLDGYLIKPFSHDEIIERLISSVNLLKARSEYKRVSKRLVNIAQAMNEAILTLDSEANITFCNIKFLEMFGLKLVDTIGSSFVDVLKRVAVCGENTEEFLECIKKIRECESFETLKTKEDQELFCKISLRNMDDFDEEGRGFLGAVITFSDVSELKKSQDEIKKKDEIIISQSRLAAMGEMISMIAHQWRQPITTIGMAVNNMQADIELDSFDTKKAKEYANTINNQVMHLSKTIDDFREFLKPDRAKDKVSVSYILKKCETLISKALQNNGIEYSFGFDNGVDMEFEVLEGELTQVLLNLIGNAKEILVSRKIENPKILVSATVENGCIVLSVEDNGGGVEDEYQDRIFEPYFSTKGEKNNSGLGLYMSKIIVQKHMFGKIWFENRNGGATFFVSIPLEGDLSGDVKDTI